MNGQQGDWTPTRREFLGGAAAAGALTGALGALHGTSRASVPRGSGVADLVRDRIGDRPNVLVLWTDQERAVQHWPDGRFDELMPSMRRLARHGLTFRNAFTAAAECSPSRATFMTSTYPVVNGVKRTLTLPLERTQATMVRLAREAGYQVAYKGKWHLAQGSLANLEQAAGADPSAPFPFLWSEADVGYMERAYGLARWNPPDAGNAETLPSTGGGGIADNDGRFVRGVTNLASGQTPGWGESTLEFLERYEPGDGPFCLFVSLVNPHDIGFFPTVFETAGYERAEFAGTGIALPDNADDSLETKPSVQAMYRSYLESTQPMAGEQDRLDYVNFYAYLHGIANSHVEAVLDALDRRGLTEDTIILRFSDHGEQGLSHGLRQKMYSAYDETIRVPLVISNPRLFPQPVETDSLASLLDLLPTVASMLGAGDRVPQAPRARGVDLGPVLEDPAATVQSSVHFTYDDIAGLAGDVAGHIRALRTDDMLYAVYYDLTGSTLEYEAYDVASDPGELVNLAFEPDRGTRRELDALHRELTRRMRACDTLPRTFPWPDRNGVESTPALPTINQTLDPASTP